MQSALNVIWKAEPKPVSVGGLVRARAISLGLVAALGFLLIASLALSAAISAFGQFLNAHLPFADLILLIINELIALALVALLFSAIYKVLPDRRLSWRDVGVGAIVTALLFTAGKSLIGWYLGSSAVASSYGAASALLVTLPWVYYSSLIFLFAPKLPAPIRFVTVHTSMLLNSRQKAKRRTVFEDMHSAPGHPDWTCEKNEAGRSACSTELDRKRERAGAW